MADVFTPAHEPYHVMQQDDAGVRAASDDLRRAIASMRRELEYRRLWREYNDLKRELETLRAVEQEARP